MIDFDTIELLFSIALVAIAVLFVKFLVENLGIVLQ